MLVRTTALHTKPQYVQPEWMRSESDEEAFVRRDWDGNGQPGGAETPIYQTMVSKTIHFSLTPGINSCLPGRGKERNPWQGVIQTKQPSKRSAWKGANSHGPHYTQCTLNVSLRCCLCQAPSQPTDSRPDTETQT